VLLVLPFHRQRNHDGHELTDIIESIATTAIRHRFALAAAVVGLLWIIETFAPMYPVVRPRGRHALANLALAGIAGAIGFAFALPLVAAVEYSATHTLGLLHRIELPAAWHWLAAFLLFDAWQYLWHRLNHRIPLLWRFHSVHHSDAAMDASTGVRFHPIEILLSSVVRLAVVPLIGMSIPMLLFYQAISLPVILFHHSNIRIGRSADSALRWLIVTPWMHWVHHSRLQPETDSNYASVLSIWDRLLGSFRLRAAPENIERGLDSVDEWHERSLAGMLLHPFAPQERSTRRSPP